MTLEDEPAAESPGPGASEASGDRPSAGDLPPDLAGDLPPDLADDLPDELPAAPPRGATSRADKRHNQRRR
ncbi:hypothetical protein Afe04nite_34550 [Asanoa ferruginea]|uniref:hypothetical protein n=1 Tax=Asanoa ferruginea TaxID=53367 RepID=UPI000E23CAC6|nr:hypothetical protein [Asanoa ferruginea]GIF48916.1 hypothetical protein Afe04nite_34550 [Asanoa ferruginea]